MAGKWLVRSLGELCDFRAGTVFKPHLQGNATGAYPFVKVSDMNLPQNERYIRTANNWVSRGDIEELRAKPLPRGTVVFAKIGEALRQNRLRSIVRETIIDNNMMGAIPHVDCVDEQYFYYALSQFDFSDIAQGTALPYLTIAGLSSLSFVVPPIPEQRAIAQILGTLDDKIELNRRNNETLETMARALFKDWFVDFGPVRAKLEGRAPYLAPELWSLFPSGFDDEGIPAGWTVEPLDQIADFLNGLALQKYPGTGHGDLPVIKIAQLRAGNAGSADRASDAVPAPYIVKDGDVLFSWSGSLLQRVWTGGTGALNQHLFKVTSTRVPKWMHYYWVDHHLASFQAIAASKATTMGHIQRRHLSEAMAVLPDAKLMTMADKLIQPMFDKLIANDLESRSLATLRDTLLPKLLSGELRVRDADTLVSRTL